MGASFSVLASARETTFVSSTQVTVPILAGDIATAGTAQVSVFNTTTERTASAFPHRFMRGDLGSSRQIEFALKFFW